MLLKSSLTWFNLLFNSDHTASPTSILQTVCTVGRTGLLTMLGTQMEDFIESQASGESRTYTRSQKGEPESQNSELDVFSRSGYPFSRILILSSVDSGCKPRAFSGFSVVWQLVI